MSKNNLSRLLALFLCLVMVFCTVPFNVLADAVAGDGEIADDTLTGEEEEDGEEEDLYADAIDVSDADELAEALDLQSRAIRIVADFALDRTFFVTADTIIFTKEAHTLTRDPNFGGDIFVVGEYEDGTVCEQEITLQMGHHESDVANLLTIDGNRDNMQVPVAGTVFFLSRSTTAADLYPNLTVVNCYKTANERTLTGLYSGLSYTEQIGGAVAIAVYGHLKVYGGTYAHNAVNDEDDTVSSRGGVFYGFGPITVYDGTFEDNHAYRAGAVYVYRAFAMYSGTMKGNTAAGPGGAIYMPASSAASILIDGDEDEGARVLFQNNTSGGSGGAIYGTGVSIAIDTTTFDNNTAGGHGGAVYCGIAGSEEIDPRLKVTNATFQNNRAEYLGGGVTLASSHGYFENVIFDGNHSSAADDHYGGGALYANTSFVEINGAEIKNNTTDYNGGGIYIRGTGKLVMNEVTAVNNSATKNGGFLYTVESLTELYSGTVRGNSANQGGGMYIGASATLHAYLSSFDSNSATGNGGGLFVYTGAVESVLHSCVLLDNTSGNCGGGMYVSSASILKVYNMTAKNNAAAKGGFMYHTTTNTTVTLNGLTVEGNTATTGGPIIWGNLKAAKLYINKTNYYDVDATTAYDDAYWAYAIVNLLTVYETTDPIPGFINYGDTEETPPESIVNPNVTNVVELQNALAAGLGKITVMSNIKLDRTLYVPHSTTLYISGNRTFTRRPEFGGDLFVIGENADGTLCETEIKAVIKPLDAESTLVIDGNKDNMTVDVTGTVFYVASPGTLELHEGLTVKNCNKVGNEKVINDPACASFYPNEIGGAVAIVAGGQLDVYGGTYTDNRVNDETETSTASSRGGVIYAFGPVNIYGGTFANNHAHRGGAFYVYRKMYIYNAVIENNTATLGGAVYIPASTGAFLYLGGASSQADESRVIFQNNSSTNSGGAIYATGKRLEVENTRFIKNSTGNNGGAIYINPTDDVATATKPALIVKDSSFEENTATSRGGAVYMTGALVTFNNTDFTGNHSYATSYGGGAIYSTGSKSVFEGVRFTDNVADYNGGGIALYAASEATLYNVTATGNKAAAYGGFIYSNSALQIYNSTFKGNEATAQGGAVYPTTGSTTSIYSTDFIENKANGGGAIRLCNGSDGNLLQNCRFIGNVSTYFGGAIYMNDVTTAQLYNITAQNNHGTHGGFLYQTTAKSSLTINGLTVSGNTDENGGPIIWGNTFNSKLYINKANYRDLDLSAPYDDGYWAKAIYYKLTVTDITDEIPAGDEYGDEDYSNIPDYVSVSNSAELEQALLNEKPYIRIIADITADRTFYVTADTTIFSATPYRITRATDFGGDLFVVGEYPNGRSVLLDKLPPVLTLGNPASTTENLLILDGNKNNMTVPVVGSLLVIAHSAKVNMYANTSLINARKVGNERTLDDAKYRISSRHKVGGAAVVLLSGTMNIYGGIIRNNATNNETAASETDDGLAATLGAAIYNQGALNIHNGTFSHNKGARGGFVYNNSMMHVYGGTFENNYASRLGGVFYLPSSASVHLYIGDATGKSENTVLCRNNSSYSGGGVLYNGVHASTIIYGKAEFSNNQSIKSSGGVAYCSGVLIMKNSVLKNNRSYSYGGALHLFNSKSDFANSKVVLENCTFTGNTSRSGGGSISATASSSSLSNGTVLNITDCTFSKNTVNNGSAPALSGGYGGALYLANRSNTTVKNTDFTGNQTGSEGGAIYAAMESTLSLTDCEFTGNAATNETKSYAGAISAHSSFVNASRVIFTNNTAITRAGALYNSYNSASTKDSVITLRDCQFNENHAGSYGGAVYSTDRNRQTDPEGEPEMDRGLFIYDTSFTGNTTNGRGGAMYISGHNNAYLQAVDFVNNQANLDDETTSYGGAIYMTGKNLVEINGGTFTGNSADVVGGIGLYSGSSIILNKITATDNTATISYGGFLACDTASAVIHDSVLQNNSAGTGGGAIYTVDLTEMSVYNTTFDGNSAGTNGGAIHIYTGASNTLLHGCQFFNNQAVGFGGAVNISGSSLLNMYNTVAKNNAGGNGGFMYETKAGTVVTVNGLTVAGNTATVGGPIIWGNTLNAKLYINKANYVDEDTATLDEAYWSAAIVNLLTVYDESGDIPTIPAYQPGYVEETPPTAPAQKEVDADKIFQLSEKSSDAAINTTFGKLPRLDNSSNFMSRNTAVYENINGNTVTADTFVYHKGETANNGNFGEGILIFQAMQYKKAHPEEKVKISFATYRFSAAAAVCVNRNSRYFGYMRSLHADEYDQYGFVRIAYLLKAAASMGIEVTIATQRNGYPNTDYTPQVPDYYVNCLSAPCDTNYAAGHVIGDYLKFTLCEWSLIGKGGSDMMHTKACAVSHYLDMNGVAHKNATWFSSSNLDGINGGGTNGNNNLQTAIIVSDHEDIYRVTVNHINLITKYPLYEEVYLFRDLAIKRATEQAKLIAAGREAEIPSDEQIVYLGSENDPVFELYFAPMGGEMANWDELNNPFAKYMRKLSNSEDSIQVIWNNVTFANFSLRNQIQDIIIDSYHKNPDPDNRIYLNLPTFDTEAFNDLEVGKDIGYMSFNKKEFGGIHNKDVQISYTENGQRYYVSLIHSMNIHGGSMGYQTNFALVVKETELPENSVYFTMADQTSTGMVEHNYGAEEKVYLPEAMEDGYSYLECLDCGKIKETGIVHRPSEWIVDKAATESVNGIAHKECQACSLLLEAKEFTASKKEVILDMTHAAGRTFTKKAASMETIQLDATPLTLEATVLVPRELSGRAGVIVGNYSPLSGDQLNLEIRTGGRPRLFFRNGKVTVDQVFETDIRSDNPVHLAVTVDGKTATLYVDGKPVETAELATALPAVSGEFKIGGDKRIGNTAYFKGTIYSVNLFSDVRTADEIQRDRIAVFPGEGNLLSSTYCTSDQQVLTGIQPIGKTFTAETSYQIPWLSATPYTVEATVKVSANQQDEAGVIVGNYNGTDGMNLEIAENGRPLIRFVNGEETTCLFDTDVRSDKAVHLAVAIEGANATLYVNGELTETKVLSAELPASSDGFVIGGDNRDGNPAYFKGAIYSVNLFGDLRTAEEIKQDIVFVSDRDQLLFNKRFAVDSTATLQNGMAGATFTKHTPIAIEKALAATPHTIEATVQLPKDMNTRAGVIVGNYDATSGDQLNLEIRTYGHPRLFFVNNGTAVDVIFKADIRSDDPVHLAVTVDGLTATLYVDGVKTETRKLAATVPETTENFKIGGDNREQQDQYFKGTIHNVSLFSDVRTADEIKKDAVAVNPNAESLLFTRNFAEEAITAAIPSGKTFTKLTSVKANRSFTGTPRTLEAVVQVPTDMDTRAGVVVGNYDATSENQLNLEIRTYGHPRLLYTGSDGAVDIIFKADIRSDDPVHLAVTVDETVATLYVNGVKTETRKISKALPEVTDNFVVGGDNRKANDQYFKGTIYSVNLFSKVKTAEEIRQDMMATDTLDESLLYSLMFGADCCEADEHVAGEWVADSATTETVSGIDHKACLSCGKLLSYRTVPKTDDTVSVKVFEDAAGLEAETLQGGVPVDTTFTSGPKTFEALIQLDKSYNQRAGILMGNYDKSTKDQINVEIYTYGKPRLFYQVNRAAYTYTFKTDIRSANMTHLAITVDGLTASLYLNGVLKETITLAAELPNVVSGYQIGSDNRTEKPQYFKGTIYSAAMFSDVRTAEEINLDRLMVTSDSDNLLYYRNEFLFGLKGKTIVNFGDSIFGNYKAPVDISSMIAAQTAATVHNVGFGSCQMSEHTTEKYNTFSMEKLADAITTGNYDLQDGIIASGTAPVAFKRCLATLKSIDFNSVDIITIAYGTNDFKNGKSLEEVRNAAQYSIETIQKKYPHIDIVLCIPVYRYWIDDAGNFVEDSSTKEINGVKLTDYIKLYKEIGKEYGLVVIDNYNGSGITVANRADCFTGTDTTHPNEIGRQMIAENMAKELCKYFG